MSWDAVAPDLWKLLSAPKVAYSWPMDSSVLSELDKLAPRDGGRWSAEEANQRGGRALREAVSQRLRVEGLKTDTVHYIHRWVVVRWGQISTPPPRQWAVVLGPHDDARLDRFAERGFDRIAAWSKVLAFADQHRFAIYDSRTSVALNLCLRELGDPRRFRIAAARKNTVVDRARRRLRELDPTHRATEGYDSYLQLLAAFVSRRCALDLLSAEQEIFANAPALATEFLYQRARN